MDHQEIPYLQIKIKSFSKYLGGFPDNFLLLIFNLGSLCSEILFGWFQFLKFVKVYFMMQNMVYSGEYFLNICNECISCYFQMECTANVNSIQLVDSGVQFYLLAIFSLYLFYQLQREASPTVITEISFSPSVLMAVALYIVKFYLWYTYT